MVWHIGELPGDDGRHVRDENGLLVTLFVSAEDARECVEAMERDRASRSGEIAVEHVPGEANHFRLNAAGQAAVAKARADGRP